MCLRQLGWLSCTPGLAALGPWLGLALPLGTPAAGGGGGLWRWRRAVAPGRVSLGCLSAPLLIFLPLGCAPAAARPESSEGVCDDPGAQRHLSTPLPSATATQTWPTSLLPVQPSCSSLHDGVCFPPFPLQIHSFVRSFIPSLVHSLRQASVWFGLTCVSSVRSEPNTALGSRSVPPHPRFSTFFL